ncbi:MAG: hypothetical protein A2X42_00975 [Candidatus Margulisbacteria bacterium GWF2_38_17]|nr:MAG: hypothetical protein A2X42_00975 [Candidatus Margulisbacteria bacterium GWF2_38_17]
MTNNVTLDIVITTNGPGEIVSWVEPVVAELRQYINARIIVALLPCRFASGNEKVYLESIQGISSVLTPAETMKLFNSKKLPDSTPMALRGIVIFLGGDLLWAYLLKKRLGYRSIAYTEGLTNFRNKFDYFFLRENDGDLMVDAFKSIKSAAAPIGTVKRITFFAGSRPNHFKLLIPFYNDIGKLLVNEGFQLFIGLSPFINEQAAAMMDSQLDRSVFAVLKGSPVDIFSNTDLLVTIPGTNTAQAAIAGIPLCVIIPLNNPEEIPLEGIFGLIGNIPFLGKYLKKTAVVILEKKIKFFSIPSMKAKKTIVPELVGRLVPVDVANFILQYAKDRNAIRKSVEDAKCIMGTGGVLEKIRKAVTALNDLQRRTT